MRSRQILSEKWIEIKRYWNDETTMNFEDRYLNEIEKSLINIEDTFKNFQEIVSNGPEKTR